MSNDTEAQSASDGVARGRPQVTGDAAIARLAARADQYAATLLDLPTDDLLTPMTGVNDAWSPRDVTAHLIGWNVLFWEGIERIVQGRVPAYYDQAEIDNDYAAINAESVLRYSATDRTALIMGLHASLADLRKVLSQLPAELWTRELHANDLTITIANEIDALMNDYEQHAADIVVWRTSLRANDDK